MSPSIRRWAPGLAVAATLLAFLPVLRCGWVAWDDPWNFLNNPHYRGLGWNHLAWMFTSPHGGNYQPLAWLTLALDFKFWGMAPGGYHLTNLLLHAANAGLFCLVCLRLLSGPSTPKGFHGTSHPVYAALFAALFWSLHPLRVEAVAWVTQRRELLAASFLLGSLLLWLKWVAGGLRFWLAASLAAYACSLLSKAGGIGFPALLLILEVYPLGRLPASPGRWLRPENRPRLTGLMPFAALAALAALGGLWSLSSSGLMPLDELSLLQRLSRACYGVVFYLGKTLWPSGLAAMYELPAHLEPFSFPFAASMAAVAAGLIVLSRRGGRAPGVAAALAGFLAAAAPLLGFVQAGSLLAADRWTYVPGMALALLAGGGASLCLRRWGARAGLVLASVCLVWGVLSWRQCRYWKDSDALWGRVLSLAPATAMAHNNLAGVLADEGRLEEASRHARQALNLRPGSASYRGRLALLLYNRGNRALRAGRPQEAVSLFKSSLALAPREARALNNLGLAWSRLGRRAQACGRFQEAVRLRPAFLEARFNLGNCLALQGRYEEAARAYQELLRADPRFPGAAENLRRVRVAAGALPDY